MLNGPSSNARPAAANAALPLPPFFPAFSFSPKFRQISPKSGKTKLGNNMNHIETLQALINDVKGNEFLGDAKKMSGYLKSMSMLADALALRYWQQFELDVIDELKAIKGNAKVTDALNVKVKLAQREFELADLQVKLINFHACAASSAFITKEVAAESLRTIASEIEAKDSALFPKPWTEDEMKAYAKSIGATYVEDRAAFKAVIERLKSKDGKASTATRNKKSTAKVPC
jgi:hypothetical protein